MQASFIIAAGTVSMVFHCGNLWGVIFEKKSVCVVYGPALQQGHHH